MKDSKHTLSEFKALIYELIAFFVGYVIYLKIVSYYFSSELESSVFLIAIAYLPPLLFLKPIIDREDDRQKKRIEARKRIESEIKSKLYGIFWSDIIYKYYRVLTKYHAYANAFNDKLLTQKLKPFVDLAMLAGGDRARAEYEKAEVEKRKWPNATPAEMYGDFFTAYPFTNISQDQTLALSLHTLTTFILDTVGEAFQLSANDSTPDEAIIRQRIDEDTHHQEKNNQQRQKQGTTILPVIPKSPEQVRYEHLLQIWGEKVEQRRGDFESSLKVLEKKFDADTLANLSDCGYLVYGKTLPARYGQDVDIFKGVVDCKEDVYKHAYIIGRTGAGKTTLINNLAAQHINNGRGLIVISPENDLIDKILDRIPPERSADLIYFDPTLTDSPIVSLNPFTLEEGELLFQRQGEVYNILTSAMGELGESMENLLNKCVYTLLQRPGSCLLDIKHLLKPSNEFRAEIVSDTRIDADTREFWRDTYGAKGSYYPKSADAILRRLDAFLMPPLSTSIARASFSLSEALNAQKSLFLFNLSRLKGLQAEIMGQFIVSMILQTLIARDHQRPHERLSYHLIIDEFQTYAGTSEKTFTEMLNRARKYRMSITLAHQVTDNIPPGLLATIIGNAQTLACMERPADDAAYFAKELQLYQDDRAAPNARALQNLDPHHFYLRTPTNKVATLVKTELDRFPAIPLPDGFKTYEAWREHLKAKSRRNFGRDIDPPEGNEPPKPTPNAPEQDTTEEGNFGVR